MPDSMKATVNFDYYFESTLATNCPHCAAFVPANTPHRCHVHQEIESEHAYRALAETISLGIIRKALEPLEAELDALIETVREEPNV